MFDLKNQIWESVKFSFPDPHVRFGKGIVEELPDAIYNLLTPPILQMQCASIDIPLILIVIGSESLQKTGKLEKIRALCKEKKIASEVYSCGSGEANIAHINNGVKLARQLKPHFIVGIGGGSVLDTAKAIAGIATNGGNVQDYHDGKIFDKPGIPFIAIPTTAGTGSEITPNAVIIDSVRGFKKSIRGTILMAKSIILDPELTLSCPPKVTANSGIDALVQAVEAFVSKNNNPLADIYALQAIELISKNLIKAYHHGEDFDARSEILLGQYFGGIALANVGLGLVHGLAHPIGYKYNIPHGRICGMLLPWVIEYNIPIVAKKYAHITKLLNNLNFLSKYEPQGSDEMNSKHLVNQIKELLIELDIPLRLRDFGIPKENLNWIVENTKGGSVNTNPRVPDPKSLAELVEKAW